MKDPLVVNGIFNFYKRAEPVTEAQETHQAKFLSISLKIGREKICIGKIFKRKETLYKLKLE